MVQHTVYPRYAYLEYVTAWSNNYILDIQLRNSSYILDISNIGRVYINDRSYILTIGSYKKS